jgi:hypothetical protein
MKQYFGGLGVPNIRYLNISLLCSWITRYNLDDDKMWKSIIQYKYNTQNPNIFARMDSQASPFWKGGLCAFKAGKFGYQWLVGNGRGVKFWEDQWFGGTSLAIHFWELYFVCNEQNKTISDILVEGELKLSFRRNFNQRMVRMWEDLVAIVQDLRLSDEDDQMVWKLNSSGSIVHSFYML